MCKMVHRLDEIGFLWQLLSASSGLHNARMINLSLICMLTAIGWCLNVVGFADEPPLNPSRNIIEKLKTEGDRLVDQADYGAALEKYTQAYHGVVSKIRGQQFSRRVLPNLLTRDELGAEILRMMTMEFTPDDLKLMDASYKVFGLMPSDLQSGELMTKLLTDEVGGFYDPDTKRMVLIREAGSNKNPGWFGRLLGAKPTFDKDEQKTVLAHEMTHALQDQLYDLNSMEKGIEEDDDMRLAFAALVEGDATTLMFAEMGGGEDISDMDPEAMRATFNMMSWLLPVAGGATYRKAPAIFRESLTFPYFQGMLFCLNVARDSGWKSIHVAYTNPPTSTEQVLHPEKYLSTDGRDEPQRVTLPDLTDSIAARWKHLGGNCLGEFQTSVMFKRLRSGRKAAAGWDGDRYEVFERNDGKLAVVFASIWDSESDAKEFADAFSEYRLGRKSKRKGSEESTDPADADAPTPRNPTIATDAQPSIRQNGNQVWIVDGFTSAEAEIVAAKLADIKFEVKHFPNPAKAAL